LYFTLMKNKAFTLLEILLVITLTLLVFGVIGFSFFNFMVSNTKLSAQIDETVQHLSLYNQLSKQLFSIYTQQDTNIKIDQNRLSFYTYYPVFYQGAVRAEYYIKKEGDKKVLFYEEFPYVDGKLGYAGLKRVVLGVFKDFSFEVFKKGKYTDRFIGKYPPTVVRILSDKEEYIITVGK